MEKFFKNIRPWMSTIILLLFAAFAIVRMQTTQAANKEIYQVDKQNFKRELDLIHESLNRIEVKLDNAIISKH